ncbi:MAG: hypothetical protein AVO39_05135 [delta proteobacterium MLS_D]|nr:MAG: hypothetical protein AVO39_05135 [delta proteobacterium MLS_D]
MPRQAFIDAPGALHHVIARGIDRTTTSRDEKDHRLFLDQPRIIINESCNGMPRPDAINVLGHQRGEEKRSALIS